MVFGDKWACLRCPELGVNSKGSSIGQKVESLSERVARCITEGESFEVEFKGERHAHMIPQPTYPRRYPRSDVNIAMVHDIYPRTRIYIMHCTALSVLRR